MPATLTAADLARLPLLANLPPATYDWLLAHGERRTFADQQEITRPGEPAEYLMAILAGGLQFYRVVNGQREPGFRLEAGQISGVLPYSRLRTISGYGVATGPTVLFVLHRNLFPELEQVSPELVQRLVSAMSDRARDEARTQERDEKLRALGKLSAGLAHELNNPTAAIGRAAQALTDRVQQQPALLTALVLHCPSPEALASLVALAEPASTADRGGFTALECADEEDLLADWLETQGVPDGYRLAASLLEAGRTRAELEPLAAALPPAARPAALAWLESQLTSRCLLRDVQEASGRISTLVSNVKTYSHMDRGAEYASLSVQTGLESTLNMLAYRLREQQIQLVRDFAPQLPPVRGQVSSLNQVWTNLLDNALDVLPVGGRLEVRTRPQGSFVQVYIIDNGPGIPPEVLPRIFEPFFTTKQAGEGTGLGLDIAQRIIRDHGGRLELRSQPGHTEFCAWLPVLS